MVKKFYGDIILHGMCYDVERMLREHQKPSLILTYIKRKVTFLEYGHVHCKIVWPEDVDKRKSTISNYFDLFPQEDKKVYLEEENLVEDD